MYTKPAIRIPAEELSELRAQLPHGAIARVANQAGVTRETVRKVLKGDWYNEHVIELACAEAQAATEASKEARIKIQMTAA